VFLRKWRSKVLLTDVLSTRDDRDERSYMRHIYIKFKIFTYRNLFGTLGRNKPLGRHVGRWDNNIKIDVKHYGWPKTGFICFRIGTSVGLL
jgi:hypothetical protein